MSEFKPRFAGYDAKVRSSFDRQPAMKSLGVSIASVTPGRVELVMPFNADFTQQHGFLHAGIVSTVLDSACGYAAFSLMEEEAAVLTVEYKANFLAPADGEAFRFCAEVVKPGRTITVVNGTAYAIKDGVEKAASTMTGTMMSIIGRSGVSQ
ncbi:MAG: PaaI family thioesterase [Pikeienuella sp.]